MLLNVNDSSKRMNPFLSALIFVPLLFSLLVSIGCLYLLGTGDFGKDVIIYLILSSVFFAYLLKLFVKTLSPKGALLEIQGVENISQELNISLTNQDVFATYFVLICGGFIFYDYTTIKGLLGVFTFCMGIFLISSGIVIILSKTPIKQSVEFQITRSTLPSNKNIYFSFAAILAIGILSSYNYFSSWQHISSLDIAGVIFLLVSSMIWLHLVDSREAKNYSKKKYEYSKE